MAFQREKSETSFLGGEVGGTAPNPLRDRARGTGRSLRQQCTISPPPAPFEKFLGPPLFQNLTAYSLNIALKVLSANSRCQQSSLLSQDSQPRVHEFNDNAITKTACVPVVVSGVLICACTKIPCVLNLVPSLRSSDQRSENESSALAIPAVGQRDRGLGGRERVLLNDRAEKRLRMRHLRPSRRENLDSSNKFLM